MAQLSPNRRELDVKIVYCGPALSGKTTNLKRLHSDLEADNKGDLLSLNTKEDRTLFFDLLPVDLGSVRGLRLRLRVYTVPGQVQYAATRRLVLGGADGVVLVLDSDRSRRADNLESLEDLRRNLETNGLQREQTPLLVQWNKRDLPEALSLAALRLSLPRFRYDDVEAVATEGRGVLPTFGRIVELALERLAARMGARELGPLGLAFRRRITASRGVAVGRHVVVRPDPQAREEAILESAVLGAVAASERAAAAGEERHEVVRQRDELRTLATISGALLGTDGPAALGLALELSLPVVKAEAGSLLLVRGQEIVETAVVGAPRDPLAGRPGPASSALWTALMSQDAVYGEDLEQDVTFCPVAVDGTSYTSGVFVRVGPSDEPRGVLCFYSSSESTPVRRDSIPYLTLLASQVSQALEQQHLRSLIEKSRRGWMATADAVEDALYVVGDSYQLKRVNQAFARHFGTSPKALVGKLCHEVLFGRATPCNDCFARRAAGLAVGSSARPVEMEGYLPDRVVLARATALPPEPGDARPVLATLHDITQRKTVARHLAESEKLAALGNVAAGIAHEINNPLASAGGNIDLARELLSRDTPLTRSERDALSDALADGQQALERVRGIVADMRRCVPEEECATADTDALELLRTSVAIARDECARTRVRLRVMGMPGLRFPTAPLRLGLALRAIIKNAIEATPDGGQVDAVVSVTEEHVRFAVRDSGPGVPGEVARRIFDPFFTTKRPGPHTGLSLSVASTAIAALDGSVELTPSGPGAEFIVLLPRAAAGAGAAERQAGDPGGELRAHRAVA